MTRVVHCKREKFDVYIGRPSKWGNPFMLTKGASRDVIISAYEAWLREQPHLMATLHELRGKVLGCWCAPKACHGDVLARLANASDPCASEVGEVKENRTRDARKSAGLTMGQAARILGVSVVHLSDVELDRAPLDDALRTAMCDHYDVSAAWLTGECERRDYAAVDAIARGLPFAERDSLAELFASRPARTSPRKGSR